MANTQQMLIDDLEQALSGGAISDRAATLRRVTDLFVVTSGTLSEEQVALFDDVMGRLLEEIESSARAAFGHILATISDAPPNVVRSLALDDEIDVAGPILTHSDRIDGTTLVESAKTKSQAHLLAISRRKALSEAVTDVLIERGDRKVALSTAENPGAAFSEAGYSELVRRSSGDDDLAMRVWMRSEIPRQHLLKLFAEASEAVKRKLTVQDPSKARIILEIVAQASQQLQTQARQRSTDFAFVSGDIHALHAAGRLDEAVVAKFANDGKFDETTIALSLICDLPISLIERAFIDQRSEQILIITKAMGMAWATVKAIIQLQAAMNGLPLKLEQSFAAYTRLNADTAKKAIQFYRLRQRATNSPSE